MEIIDIVGFLDGERNNGLTTRDAIKELVDNSLDAGATEIYVGIVRNDNQNIDIFVKDNGKGIDSAFMNKILSFGGRVPNGRGSIGRFGVGLSSAACCQSLRTEIYSKNADSKNRYSSYLDIEEIKKTRLLPSATDVDEIIGMPHIKLDGDNGTIVVFRNCDNLERQRIDTLSKHIVDDLGETYRYIIKDGVNIYVNDEPVSIVDPLMLIENCKNINIYGKGDEKWDIEPIVMPGIIDPETGKDAEIMIKVSMMDMDKIRESGIKETGFNMANQGFYIIRHNRQIGRSLTLDMYEKHNSMNYFRGEIIFPIVLDKYFGVQKNKSRFSVDSDLKEEINKNINLKNVFAEIKEIYGSKAKEGKTKNIPDDVTMAEMIMATVNKELKEVKYQPTNKELAEEKTKEEKARKEKDEKIDKIKKNDEVPKEERDQMINEIENRFQLEFDMPRKIVYECHRNGPFYDVFPGGKHTEIRINTDHPFFTKIYEKATQNKELLLHLNLFLYTLAKAQMDYMHSPETREFYENQINERSLILKKCLKVADSTDYYKEE
ncbi:MAG: ATP-binding protein [candidate division SR1 bacterium]|nr:ATP-binding protein [candidate division SR1 bacterium]